MPNGPASLRDLIQRVFAAMVDPPRAKDQGESIATGLAALDEATGGLRRGAVTLVAGRPGMGVTAFGLSVALNVARSGHPVLYCSLADEGELLTSRLLCMEAKVPFERIRDDSLTNDDWAKVTSAAIDLERLPLWIDPSPRLSVGEVADGHDVVFIDAFESMRDASGRDYGTPRLGRLAGELRAWAHKRNAAVVLLGDHRRPRRRWPTVAQLRQPDVVRHLAAVWFLWRPAYDDGDADPPDARIIVAKGGRRGAKMVRLRFEPMWLRLEDARAR